MSNESIFFLKEIRHNIIGLDKSGYQVNIFLFYPQKLTLW